MNTTRKISFGKVDGYHIGKKNCEVTAELKYENGNFSASANLWYATHANILMGGQCFDSLASEFPELLENEVFAEVVSLWKEYHLNYMHAGTKAQEYALKDAVKNGILPGYGANYYKESCDYLDSLGLLYDRDHLVEKTDKAGTTEKVPYKYGSGWIKEEIPEEDAKRIEHLINYGTVLGKEEMER